MKENLNYLNLHEQSVGNERRKELYGAILDGNTLLPNTLTYKDIDKSFKEWVDNDIVIVSDEGKTFPTMTLYSNQRFSEYSQTWKFTDKDNNLLLNFKSVSRENNPQYGKIQNGFWNIPGERFYTMKKLLASDEAGNQYLKVLKMRQPVAIDFMYTLTVFTTKYEKINEFNEMINKIFSARQAYIRPNGHYLPMTLEGIDDESEYNINDRQYYAQSYLIKVMGYIITEKDYRVEEYPYKTNIGLHFGTVSKGVSVEIEEKGGDDYYNDYYNKPISISVTFTTKCRNKVSFTMDDDFKPTDFEVKNILRNNFRIMINGVPLEKGEIGNLWRNGDRILITISKLRYSEDSTITINGYSPNHMFDGTLDYQEIDDNISQYGESVEISDSEKENNE